MVNATQSGTGREANLYNSIGITTAGKTGTTANSKDRWYAGFTGYYTAVIWVGYDSPEVIRLVNGGNPAAQLWKKIMQPLHKGLKNIPLYNDSAMSGVSVCLDSGKIATDACNADIRDVNRVASAQVYPEDRPAETCDKHVMMDYCVSGNGVANEYCKKFAQVDSNVKIQQVGLLKITKAKLEEILKAENNGLNAQYLLDKYVYLVDKEGKDDVFKGFHNNANNGVDAPYIVCKTHTQAGWENYQSSHNIQTPVPDDGNQGEEDTGNSGGITFH